MYQLINLKAPIRNFTTNNVNDILKEYARFLPVEMTYSELKDLIETGVEVNLQGIAKVKKVTPPIVEQPDEAFNERTNLGFFEPPHKQYK